MAKKKAKKTKAKKKATSKKVKKAKKVKAKKSAPKKAAKKVAKKKLKAKKKPAAKKAKVAKKASAPQAPKAAKAAAPKAPKPVKAVVEAGPHPLLGASAPDITVAKQNGEMVNLSSVVQSTPQVVLYFYPKDDTPGCTTEACGFRDNLNRLQATGATVLGVSPDDPESHQKFIEKYNLNFDLLSDTDKKLCEAFGVWKEKNFMGRNYMGVERSTFLFKNGSVSKVWQPVKVEGHVDDVLSNLDS